MFYLIVILKLIGTLFTSLIILLSVILLGLKVYNTITTGKCRSKVRLDGKVALVTGGNTGIGLETAKDLARRGATVIIASRDVKKSARAVEDIIASTGNQKVECKHLDLTKFSSVRTFAEEFNKNYARLDILVNNSGTAGLKHGITGDGIDVVTQINYFGPFLLTNLLLDKVIAAKPSRIIIVSSKAHFYAKLDVEDLKVQIEKPWHTIYANTKLCNVLWAKALANKVPDGVTVNALHPGLVNTDIFDRFGPIMRKLFRTFVRYIYKSPEEGAQTSIHLAVAEEVEQITGRYFEECAVADESKEAKDEDLIEKVWEKSLLITNTELKQKYVVRK